MRYLTEREYILAIGKILVGTPLEPDEARAFVATISKFESLLDENDDYDPFISRGWKGSLNW